MKEKVYYVGFNANNAICNESFFEGSITLYPTNEKGNIPFIKDGSKKINNLDLEYKAFVEEQLNKITSENSNAKIMCFNEKAKKVCKNFNNYFTLSNNDDLILMLNDKFKTRELLKNEVPILNYIWLDDLNLSYDEIANRLNSSTFVVQAKVGAGGNTTYNVTSDVDYSLIKERSGKFCVSSYISNTPLNVTAIITNDKDIIFPVSAQLILSHSSNFTYVGGDFVFASTLNKNIISDINKYTKRILGVLKNLGYRGIIGIDYILTKNDEILFMEINPRFQASSFLINLELKQKGYPCLAELNYKALNNIKIGKIEDININKSFLNCGNSNEFNEFKDFKILLNGYSKLNKNSVYRKIFDYSLINNDMFEHIK